MFITFNYSNIIRQIKLMTSAFVSEEKLAEDTKNAKILQRKQVEKRLQGLKTEQYQKISANLKMQNEKLKSEVRLLSQKVQELVQSRKINKIKNPQIEQQISRMKRELDLKYESMAHIKDQVSRLKQSDMTEEMKLKIQEHTNIVMKCNKECRQLQAEREKLKIEIDNNQADLKEFLPSNQFDTKMETLRIENKQLKSKINAIKEELTQQQKSSKITINKIYELKGEQRRTLAKSTHQITASLKEIKSVSLSEISELQKQIQSLKNKKKECEKDWVAQKIIKQAKKSKLQKEIKERLQAHKQLYKKRVKGVNELNYYQCKELQLKHQLQKSTEVVTKVYQAAQAQTQKIVMQQFRKEWIGKSEGLLFNDAEFIQYRGQSLIKGVTIYKTPENIVFAKFHYQSPEKKKYQSQPPFEKFVLKKCQAKKYESKSLSYLSGLIVSVHSQSKRVVRMELKWGDGDCSIIGWEIEGSIRFPFDIGQKERPICMFGSVCSIGKFSYVLESLGCEINSSQQ